MSKCKSVILCSFQSFTLQWGHNISWVSCANQLQPAYSISDYVYLLLNINNQAVFGTINTTDGSSFTNVYVSSETWTWVSFVKSASSYVVIGFQDSSTSYIKIYYYGGVFATYVLTSSIKLFAFAKNNIYSSV